MKNFKIILSRVAKQYPQLTHSGVIANIPSNEQILRKDFMADVLVKFFAFVPNNREEDKGRYYFKDTAYSSFGDEVEDLAKK
ncbi:MAG: hypothetical protein GXP45_08525 [bacterium]|nr:hypothetical protein [bacterium]